MAASTPGTARTCAAAAGGSPAALTRLERARVPPAATRTGHGLRGMRERAALYGGEVTAGPLAGGGFAVVLRLPVQNP